MVFCLEVKRTSLGDGKSIFQKFFKHSHYHTIGHIEDTFGGEKHHQCSRSFSSFQKTEGRECCMVGRNPTWNAQGFESRSHLADSCVSSGLVHWEERLAHRSDHPHTQGGKQRSSNYSGIFFLSLLRKVYVKCLKKDAAKQLNQRCRIPSAIFVSAVEQRTKFSLSSKYSRYIGSMSKTFTHVLSTLRKHMTAFLVKGLIGEYCGSTVLTHACY